MKVLIPTSGTGSRLMPYTRHTNKALVRFGQKPFIAHVIDFYPQDFEFVITLGYKGDLVKQFLKVAYPKRKFTFVEVDVFDGPGSSVAYSISKAREYLQEPFIFHACDALIKASLVFDMPFDYNWILGQRSKDIYSFRRIGKRNEKVFIEEKKEGDLRTPGICTFDVYTGIAGIYDYKEFWKELEGKQGEHEALNRLSKLRLTTSSLWIDAGSKSHYEMNRDKYANGLSVLPKEEEDLFFLNDGRVVKFFVDPYRVLARVVRQKQILKKVTPNIKNFSKNFYSYKKKKGTVFSQEIDSKTLKQFLEWCSLNLWRARPFTLHHEGYAEDLCEEFYIKKTQKRVEELYRRKDIGMDWDTVSIKGIKNNRPLCFLLDKFKKIITEDYFFTKFHGDLVVDNVIVNNSKSKSPFTLIDWREDFAGSLHYGDIYYDLAKLNHSLVLSHKNLLNRNAYANLSGKEVSFFLNCPYELLGNKPILDKWIINNGYSLKKVEILTALIWINMAPLHGGDLGKFLFLFGKYHLNKIYEEQNS